MSQLTSASFSQSPGHGQIEQGPRCVFKCSLCSCSLQAGWENLIYLDSSSGSSQPHLIGLALDVLPYQRISAKKLAFLARVQVLQ